VGGESSDWNAGGGDSANRHAIDYANDVKMSNSSCGPPLPPSWPGMGGAECE